MEVSPFPIIDQQSLTKNKNGGPRVSEKWKCNYFHHCVPPWECIFCRAPQAFWFKALHLIYNSVISCQQKGCFIISINQTLSAKVILRIKQSGNINLSLQLSVRVTAAGRPPTMACPRWRSWRSTPPPRTSSTGRKNNPLHSISATSQIFWLKKAGFDGVWWPESRDFVKIQGAFSPEFSTTGPTLEWLQVYHVHMWCIEFIWPILVRKS